MSTNKTETTTTRAITRNTSKLSKQAKEQPNLNPPERDAEEPWFCPICSKNLDDCECPSWYTVTVLKHGWGEDDDYSDGEITIWPEFKVEQREHDGKWLVTPYVGSLFPIGGFNTFDEAQEFAKRCEAGVRPPKMPGLKTFVNVVEQVVLP